MQVHNDVYPADPAQLQSLMEKGPSGPIFMVNLLKFKDKAEHEDGRANVAHRPRGLQHRWSRRLRHYCRRSAAEPCSPPMLPRSRLVVSKELVERRSPLQPTPSAGLAGPHVDVAVRREMSAHLHRRP